eukprot:3953363-Amphidinium_carterae.2
MMRGGVRVPSAVLVWWREQGGGEQRNTHSALAFGTKHENIARFGSTRLLVGVATVVWSFVSTHQQQSCHCSCEDSRVPCLDHATCML